MLFEVYERHEETVGFRGSIFRTYSTRLSHILNEKSVMTLSLGEYAQKLPMGDLGGPIEFEENQKTDNVHIHRMYPFGVDPLGRKSLESGGAKLLRKGISGAVEYLLLAQFPDQMSVSHDGSAEKLRQSQLARYGALNKHTLGTYRSALERSLRSPHFEIVKFPAWITDPEVLQLSGKG